MLVFPLMMGILGFIFGIFVLVYSSDKAVKHSIAIASAWKISPFLIGLLLVSVGTDVPEIANSVISSWAGHGNINVGDSIGSVLTQITLVFGLIALLVKDFTVDKKEVLVMGVCEILALILVISIVEKGYISVINAFFLVASWVIFMLICRITIKKEFAYQEKHEKKTRHFIIAIIGFIGVAFGAYVVVQSIITLSTLFPVSEFYISFFIAAIGTSLPELAVDLNAIRKKEYELAMGDVIGSCIVDASLSIGIGPMLFSNVMSSELDTSATISALYALFASFIVILTLVLRGKVDRKAGILFIAIYSVSYPLLLLK